jgi:polysaccharide transporter, PST family
MNLMKTSILSLMANIVKMATGFIINKVIAIYAGPSGIAQIGNFQNFFAIISSLSTGSINQGVTKYIATYRDLPSLQRKYIDIAFSITFICSCIIGTILIVFNRLVAKLILNDVSFSFLFLLLGILLILYAMNNILLSIINGFKEIKKYVTINIFSSILSLLISVPLTILFSLEGALYSLILSQTFIIFLTIIFIRNEEWFKKIKFRVTIQKNILKDYLNYSIISLIHVLTVPVSYFIIRNYIMDNLSTEEAGYWQGIMKISETYLMFITISLSTYYLPILSETKDYSILRKEIISGFKFVIPVILLISLIIFILKDYIILILYSKDFLEMRSLFLFQLIGDIFKISSWLISFIMVAKTMTKLVILTEIIYSISFVILSLVFINFFGLIGVTYAYALSYFLYFLLVGYLLKDILFFKSSISKLQNKDV